jgi:hypothetical protein
LADEPVFKARKRIDYTTLKAAEDYNRSECKAATGESLDCAAGFAYQITYYYEHKDFNKIEPIALKLLGELTAYTENGPCPAVSFAFGGRKYNFGYYQNMYQIYRKTNPKKAVEMLVRAFACEAIFTDGYTDTDGFTHIDSDPLGLPQFKRAVSQAFGESERYDVDLFVNQIVTPMTRKYLQIRKGKKWTQSDLHDVNDGVAIVQLVQNAAAFCERRRLDPAFCDVLQDYSEWVERANITRSNRL